MSIHHKKSIVWIRRDLRLLDHTALSRATHRSDGVAVVFVFDTEILKHLKDKKDKRITFIYDSIKEIDEELRKQGSKLIVRQGNPIKEIPKLVKELGAEALFFNEDYEPYAHRRDNKIKAILQRMEIPSYSYKDHVIFSASELLKPNKSPYKMFTPYKKTWIKKLKRKDFNIQKVKKRFMKFPASSEHSIFPSLDDLGFERASFFYEFQNPGRKNALKQLKKFSKNISEYQIYRDFPHINGTSGLSVHLRFGTLSVRECIRLSLQSKSKGHRTWLSEIIWRDFYHMILFQFPHVKSKAFNSKYSDIVWSGSKKHYQDWCKGRTGFPIIDAAMRQLNETGWMHNRLRMIVASFLTKDLLVDWRKGESYFAEKLLDFDLASNNGGWQWSASTGCDAQPYFRVFNPELQSRKFDPTGDFLRLWLPELEGCSNKEIHCPENIKNYPIPIVNHQNQRLRAIQLFKMSS